MNAGVDLKDAKAQCDILRMIHGYMALHFQHKFYLHIFVRRLLSTRGIKQYRIRFLNRNRDPESCK